MNLRLSSPPDEVVEGAPHDRRAGRTSGFSAGRAAARRRRVIQASSLLAGALAWEVYGRVWGSNFTIPPLSDVVAKAPDVLTGTEFWTAIGTTLGALALGMAISLTVGFAIGALSGLNRSAERIAQPYTIIALASPMVTVIPIIQLAFGLELAARLAVVVLFSVPYFIVNVAAGYRSAPADLIDMCTTFGISKSQTFVRVRTLSAAPMMLAGLRMAVARGFVGVISAEILVLSTGIGRLISRESQTFNTSGMYVLVLAVLFVAFAMLQLISLVERHVLYKMGLEK